MAAPPRRRSPLLILLAAALAALVVALSLAQLRGQQNVATPSSSPTATATPSATSTAAATATAVATTGGCQEMTFQAGDTPIVAPRRAGQHLEVALDAVRPGPDNGNRWFVRFFVPAGAPGPAEIPLRATVTGPAGPLQTVAYEAGPPNAGSAPVTQPVTLQACAQSSALATPFRGTVLLGVQTAPVRSGTYTLTWSDIRLPEGGTRTETWTVTLTCTVAPGPPGALATQCT